MSRYKNNSHGRLSGDDLDTLVRWGLHASVADAQPSDAVWQRIKANAGVRRQAPRRSIMPARVVRRLAGVPAGGLGSVGHSLRGLLRFIGSIMEAYDHDWPEAHRPRWAFTPGLLWIMLATDQRIY